MIRLSDRLQLRLTPELKNQLRIIQEHYNYNLSLSDIIRSLISDKYNQIKREE